MNDTTSNATSDSHVHKSDFHEDGLDEIQGQFVDAEHTLLIVTGVCFIFSPGLLWCLITLTRKHCQRLQYDPIDKRRIVLELTPTDGTDNGLVLSDAESDKRDGSVVMNAECQPEDEMIGGEMPQRTPSAVCAAIMQFDKESCRILKLSLQYSLATAAKTLFPSIILAVVSKFLGMDAASAYSVSELVLGLTGEFVGSLINAGEILASQALGMNDGFLVGQYAQISAFTYTVAQVFFLIVLGYLMGDLMKWLGYDPNIAQMAEHYTIVAILRGAMKGQVELYNGLLGNLGHEFYASATYFLGGIIEIGGVGVGVVFYKLQLEHVPIVQLVMNACFFILNFSFTYWKGWTDSFLRGMIGNCALKNYAAVRRVLVNALPLAVGILFNYGEWLVLAIFASYHGTVETTAWAMFSEIWEACEILLIGIGDAGEVRSAFHLGAGRPEAAKVAAYRALLLGTACATVTAAFIATFGSDIPLLFTDDPFLRTTLKTLVPFLAIAVLDMPFVLVCWALLGGQCRYDTAVFVIGGTSWFLTVPLGATFTYGFEIGVEGLASATVVGYIFAAVILTNTLLFSDWERISEQLQEGIVSEGDDDGSAEEQQEKMELHAMTT